MTIDKLSDKQDYGYRYTHLVFDIHVSGIWCFQCQQFCVCQPSHTQETGVPRKNGQVCPPKGQRSRYLPQQAVHFRIIITN